MKGNHAAVSKHICDAVRRHGSKSDGKRAVEERAAQGLFRLCAAFTVLAVASIIFYIMVSGLPAVLQIGWRNLLFGTVWKPTAAQPQYGIFYVILTSIVGTFLAAVIGVPIGVLTAVFLAEFSSRRIAGVVKCAVELQAGIPSVIYGLVGVYLLNPLMYRAELWLFRGSENHQFTGGANLLSAAVVLAVMILPTVISVSETAISAVRPGLREASLALGASRIQTVFRSVLPSARSGITAAVVLGVGRAVGEAMAITLVSGGSVNAPFPFHSVRFLTTAIVSEMGYAQGTHRQVLFTIALVLLFFVMMVQLLLQLIVKKGEK